MKKTAIISYIVLGVLLILNIVVIFSVFPSQDVTVIYNNNIDKIVEIKVFDEENVVGYATGFFIDESGTIITNRHVVINSTTNSPYQNILVRLATDNDWRTAELIDSSDTEDIATIKLNNFKSKFFQINKNIKNGARIYTIGNPNGMGLSFIEGVVSCNNRVVIHNNTSFNTIQTSFVINEGNSGGPVFDINGRLIGMISFRLRDDNSNIIQGVAFAIHASTIINYMMKKV